MMIINFDKWTMNLQCLFHLNIISELINNWTHYINKSILRKNLSMIHRRSWSLNRVPENLFTVQLNIKILCADWIDNYDWTFTMHNESMKYVLIYVNVKLGRSFLNWYMKGLISAHIPPPHIIVESICVCIESVYSLLLKLIINLDDW